MLVHRFSLGLVALTLSVAIANVAQAKPKNTGKLVFDHWCSSCHGPNTDSPGTGALAAKYKGEVPAQLDRRTDLDPETVKYFVRNGVSVMPPFRKTEITDSELESLARYLAAPQK